MRRHGLAVGKDAAFVVQAQHFERDRRAHQVCRVGRAVADRGAGGCAVGNLG